MANPIVQTIIAEVEQAVISIIEKILAGGVTSGEGEQQLRSGLDELKNRHHGR